LYKRDPAAIAVMLRMPSTIEVIQMRTWQVAIQWLDIYLVEHVVAASSADCWTQMRHRYPCCVVWSCKRVLSN
jgi:hypothetical protein